MSHYVGAGFRNVDASFRRSAGFRPMHMLTGAFDTFFATKSDGLSQAQTIGAPLIPIGVGVAALMIILKKPEYVPAGVMMSAAGIALLAIAKKKQDDSLAAKGIVSGAFGDPHPNWVYDQNAGGWVPG